MNVRKRVAAVFIVSLFASIFIVGFVFDAERSTQENITKIGIVSDLRTDIFFRANMLDEYLLYRKVSFTQQWFLASQRIDTLLGRAEKTFFNADEALSLALIKTNNDIIKQTGAELFENYSLQSDPEKMKEAEARLVSKLLASSTEMVNEAGRLDEVARQSISYAQAILGLSVWLVTILLFIIIAINLTWIRMVVKRFERTAAKEAAMLESTGDGMIAVDEKGRIITMSRSAEKMLGRRPKEMLGKDLSEIIPMIDENGKPVSDEKRPMRIALASGKNTSINAVKARYSYVRKNGSSFPIALDVAPVILEGKIIGAIDNFRDITAEKEVDRAKSEFVSLASHQLRTPPTNIKWFLEMLISQEIGPLNEKQKEYISDVQINNQRMITLINALLNTSRIELGVLAVEPSPTDIVALVKGVVDEMKPQIKGKQLLIKEKYSNGLQKILVDAKLLRIVAQNIVSNAVKYTPAKGLISVEVFLKQKNESIGMKTVKKESLALSVSDTGYGIPKDQQNKIFTKLFRADNVKEKETNGTGLGLYLTKSIIEHLKGDIWFESAIGKGTTFYVAIPLEGMKKVPGTAKLVADPMS